MKDLQAKQTESLIPITKFWNLEALSQTTLLQTLLPNEKEIAIADAKHQALWAEQILYKILHKIKEIQSE